MSDAKANVDKCRAILITPGKPGSAQLGTVAVADPGTGELLLKVRAVGICGTDGEIDRGLYGTAPAGSVELVLGHESLTEVAAVGPGVSGWTVGQLGVAIVRRPCPERCAACAVGRWDFCLTGHYREHGIKGLDGFLREYFVASVDDVVPVPANLADCAVLIEPLSIVEKAVEQALSIHAMKPGKPARALVTGAGPVGMLGALLLLQRGLQVWILDQRPADSAKARLIESAGAHYIDDSSTPLESVVPTGGFDVALEATGYAPLVFRMASTLAPNGVLALTGVTGGHREMSVDVNAINGALVLENQAMVGSVNAARAHYEQAILDLGQWKTRWGDLPSRLITSRYPLERFRDALKKDPDDIKTIVEVNG